MSLFDVVVRNATVVTRAQVRAADVAISDGVIAAVEPEVAGSCRSEIAARGLHVFPGVIDAHVHFNEPGREDWEGLASGSRALAAGGATAFFDMPLNADPPTVDAASFDRKRAAAERSSLVDFALWGGLVGGDLDRLDALAERGVVGFKAFMSSSGIAEFPAVDDLTLLEGMARAARLGAIVALHAENDTLTRGLARRAAAEGRKGARDYLDSRPVVAELEAIARATVLADEARCAIHIVHVSSGRGVAVVAEARARGVDVTCETCPHYLVLTGDDVERLGAIAKCAPPVRDADEQERLWRALERGEVTLIASDHSPSPPAMKASESFFDAWGGISGCQSTLPLLLTEGHALRGLSLETIAALTSAQVAERFGLAPQKGEIAAGGDADLTLVDLDAAFVVESGHLLYRHRHTPYAGRRLQGRVARTLVRGRTVFDDGRIVSEPIGRLVRPARRAPARG